MTAVAVAATVVQVTTTLPMAKGSPQTSRRRTKPPERHENSSSRRSRAANWPRSQVLDILRGRWTVRGRVLAAVLSLSAAGLVVAGATAYAVQLNNLNEEMDSSLARGFSELQSLMDTGIDPDTGATFSNADRLVYMAMERTMPSPSEGMMGVRNGTAFLVANNAVSVRLEDDPGLVRASTERARSRTVRVETLTTNTATYRSIVVPLKLAQDDEPVVFVRAFDIGAERADLNRTFGLYALVSLLTVVATGLAGWFLMGNLLKPIRRLRDTTKSISDSDLSQRIHVTGNDDLSELTRTVNAMLDRLESSFSSQRQLLDDVGHELRTPITIIQGHLELQDSTDVSDVDAVRAVALDELDRMRLLVDDLVTLAGSSRPDFVRTSRTHAGQLTDEVLDKARGLGPRRWVIDERTEASTDLDSRRILQAWLQLAVNAVKFSTEGSTVAVGSAADGNTLRLWVRDEGVGVAPRDYQRIFARFVRGSNSKRADGSGLGLTIVSAIAEAHRGQVDLVSEVGAGSTFTLVLPLRPDSGSGSGTEETAAHETHPGPDGAPEAAPMKESP